MATPTDPNAPDYGTTPDPSAPPKDYTTSGGAGGLAGTNFTADQSQSYLKGAPDATNNYLQSRKLQDQYLQTIQGQVGAANQAVKAQQDAQQANLANLRAQAAQALAGGRGLLGGGRGLALQRQSALSTGLAQGQARTQGEQAIAAARQNAAAAQTQAITEQQKVLQAEEQRQANIQTAVSSARAIFNDEVKKQHVTWSAEDRARTIARIRSEVLTKEQDPEVIAQVNQLMSDINSGKENAPGLIDT